MAYTTIQLITDAYYLSGIVSNGLQSVSGGQLNDGLRALNAVIAVKTANSKLIPYFKEYDFVAVVGQERYFVPNLLEIETFTFFIGPVRYSTSYIPRRRYQGSGRVENIQSLPFDWYFERQKGGGTLFVYFLPSQEFPMQIWGKFSLSSVVLNQDLELTLDNFYIEYLRYALAEYICSNYNRTFQPQSAAKLREYENVLITISPPDLTLTKVSSLRGGPALNWGDVNVGMGYRP